MIHIVHIESPPEGVVDVAEHEIQVVCALQQLAAVRQQYGASTYTQHAVTTTGEAAARIACAPTTATRRSAGVPSTCYCCCVSYMYTFVNTQAQCLQTSHTHDVCRMDYGSEGYLASCCVFC